MATADDAAYEALVATWLARPGITTKRMLVSDGLAAANGQVFAFAHRGGLAVKLPAPRIDELEAADRATRLSTGARTMREWPTSAPTRTGRRSPTRPTPSSASSPRRSPRPRARPPQG